MHWKVVNFIAITGLLLNLSSNSAGKPGPPTPASRHSILTMTFDLPAIFSAVAGILLIIFRRRIADAQVDIMLGTLGDREKPGQKEYLLAWCRAACVVVGCSLIISFPLAIAAFLVWHILNFIAAALSGWISLAARYRQPIDLGDLIVRHKFTSVNFGARIPLRGSCGFHLAIHSHGISLHPAAFLVPFKPPLYIPWTEMHNVGIDKNILPALVSTFDFATAKDWPRLRIFHKAARDCAAQWKTISATQPTESSLP